jgi:hypothetical protein
MNTCNHTKSNGVPCGSPSMGHSPLCYFHGRILERALRNPEGPMVLGALDSSAAVLAALSQLTLAIAANGIDLKRAGILLRALTLAARLASTVARANEAEAAAIHEAAEEASAAEPQPPAEWTLYTDAPPAELPTQLPKIQAAVATPRSRHQHPNNRQPRSHRHHMPSSRPERSAVERPL